MIQKSPQSIDEDQISNTSHNTATIEPVDVETTIPKVNLMKN